MNASDGLRNDSFNTLLYGALLWFEHGFGNGLAVLTLREALLRALALAGRAKRQRIHQVDHLAGLLFHRRRSRYLLTPLLWAML
jgi:hypothetical protein